MTARKPPSETYREREARHLASYRAAVIGDPSSHPDHVDAATRLLTLPTEEAIGAYVSALRPAALIALRAAIRGDRIPCGCSTRTSVEPVDQVKPDPAADPPATPPAPPDPEPAPVKPAAPTENGPVYLPNSCDDAAARILDYSTSRRRR